MNTYYKPSYTINSSNTYVNTIESRLSLFKQQIEDSIAFQNKCNRRKAKIVKSCKNTFRAKKWR